jgi:hypothetical protein
MNIYTTVSNRMRTRFWEALGLHFILRVYRWRARVLSKVAKPDPHVCWCGLSSGAFGKFSERAVLIVGPGAWKPLPRSCLRCHVTRFFIKSAALARCNHELPGENARWFCSVRGWHSSGQGVPAVLVRSCKPDFSQHASPMSFSLQRERVPSMLCCTRCLYSYYIVHSSG